jgi:D-sedoheptulose 7-phosphate isomerase
MKSVEAFCALASETVAKGNKILFCGNGGSAADCQHLSAEFIGRFKKERPSIGAIALTVDTSALTALGNDYGFDTIFARQVEGLGKKGDLLVGITTSGSSPNIINAMKKAKEMGLKTVGMTGFNEKAEIKKIADVCVCVPSLDTPRIQEAHIMIGHIMCDYVETEAVK